MRLFTLVELMIVVAIIGILAGIAVPAFREMQSKAKASELPLQIDGMGPLLRMWREENTTTATVGDYQPRQTSEMDKRLVSWGPTGGWATIGWLPDGAVRGSYRFSYDPIAPRMRLGGYIDVDDDDVMLAQVVDYAFAPNEVDTETLTCVVGPSPCY